MTESGQRALMKFKGDPICLMEDPKKILASQEFILTGAIRVQGRR